MSDDSESTGYETTDTGYVDQAQVVYEQAYDQ
jgi:hypothetical protein